MIAANGTTKVFSKSGKQVGEETAVQLLKYLHLTTLVPALFHQVKTFPSNLPGGNRNQGGRSGKAGGLSEGRQET